MSVRGKLMMAAVGVSAAGILVIAIIVETAARRSGEALADGLLLRGVVEARHVAAQTAEAANGGAAAAVDRSLATALEGRPDIVGAAVYGADGSVLARRGDPLPAAAAAVAEPARAGRAATGFIGQSCGGCHPVTATVADEAILASSAVTHEGRRIGSVVIASRDARLAQLRGGSRAPYLLAYLAVLLVIGFFIHQIGGRILGPLREMATVAHRVAAGDISHAELRVRRDDEIGELAVALNRLLASEQGLAAVAQRMAAGDLGAKVELEGQVADAFNHMADTQRAMVRQITEVSVQLASASTQIYAAAQEQEAATAQQAAGVEEVSHSMDSLLGSAAHIAESAGGVLANAERNKETTDATSRRIAELSGHATRMVELLETIREIADRSDLLALNASLEATRAGEAGRAFSLVAGEMRRLAERVTGSVEGVKSLVADIRSFGSATVMAMEEARKLAEGTTGSARHITLVTQQQRSATEQISQSMRAIASVLGQSATAAQETRTSAEVLKTQAEHLTAIVKRFRLDGPTSGV